jgi:general secretion pathway protein C
MTVGMNDNRAMLARLSAFVIWALVAAGLVFWGYRLWAGASSAPAGVQAASLSSGDHGDLSRLLGAAAGSAAPAPVAKSSRYRLLGVLAPVPSTGAAKPSTAGVALIAVDGKPARAFVVGSRLDGELVLQSVSRRAASIGPAQGAATVVLELAPPSPPSTGTLPRALAEGDATRAQPAPAAVPVPAPALQPPPQESLQPQAQLQSPPPAESADDNTQAPRSRRSMVPNPASTR